ncbi:hypothetical protein [Methylotenera sp.]|uniref:hypothetical protein n=1 Tax=Methylotenera sp. TaxID=2051956 RepID=UPI00273094A2|nr:hypothetical protein [Methylotenera sp.]MDP2071748.1 hypothetical protein [Methylotenera sp.]MDP3006387.1 hypothetical protein [Methylotenera sp.]
MAVISSPDQSKLRYPSEVNSIQVNFCRNPLCANFGHTPAVKVSRGRPQKFGVRITDTYIISGGRKKIGRNIPSLICKLCRQSPTIKSNQAISEEHRRISAYLRKSAGPRCPNIWCCNHFQSVSDAPDAYQAFGKTAAGAQRYRCKDCGTTLSVQTKSTSGQQQSHKNRTIFSLLMNKSPFRRICEVADISPSTLYNRIDFLHRQCLAFAGEREREKLLGIDIQRLHVSIDRQDYVVNWSNRIDKRNVTLTAMGSADNLTGFVFGMNLNFDGNLNPEVTEIDAINNGDYDVDLPYRKYARVWLKSDYLDALSQIKSKAKPLVPSSLSERIETKYANSAVREDYESTDEHSEETQLPRNGMQTHFEYTVYGHFFYLRELFKNVGKVRFYIDQDSAIRAACLSSFWDRIRARTVDAYYVQINKDLTNEAKLKRQSRIREALKRAMAAHPTYTEEEIQLMFIRARMAKMKPIGKWGDMWLRHPFPRMDEPKKAVCHLTNYDDYNGEHAARLYYRATLAGIDRFFMQVRCRICMLERPFKSPARAGRTYFAYNAYNPEIIVKLLGIFRVFYNYVAVGEDKMTPAMRLGLAKGPIKLEDIIYFIPEV